MEVDVREARSSSRFTTRVPGSMYSPWITTMSSGHDVSEYELGVSGLPPIFHHKNCGKIDENPRKVMIFRKKKKLLVWKDCFLTMSVYIDHGPLLSSND